MRDQDLDQLDRNLIQLLEDDGRASFSKLAAELSLSTEAVSARYKRLEASGTVRVVGVVNPPVLGFDTIAALAITNYGDTDAVIRQLVELPEVTFLAKTRGEVNIMGELACSNAEELVRIAYDVIPSLSTSVRRVEVWDFLRVDKWTTGVRSAPEPTQSEHPLELDAEDLQLLQLLQQNARLRYTELADALGMPYGVARRRSQRLLDEGVVVPAVVVDSLAVEHQVMATVGLCFAGSPTEGLAAIAALPQVEILIRAAGRHHALAETRCGSMAELSTLVDEQLMGAPGVTDASTYIYARIEKLPAQWRFDLS